MPDAAGSAVGRCDLPVLGVPDEAASACRWRGLSDLFAHFESRGPMFMPVFQLWAQIESATRNTMPKVVVGRENASAYLGGVSGTSFLERLSDLSGH